ncbi:uncharacterized protein [Dermacentor albipictus]|uniref:uncharacterized protein isoform X1 n=1 Tax=Dermacentor albipictus TaxID=60249 RepID=UPI0031FE0936
MSASASSMITSAATDALASNSIVEKGVRGLVAWLVLVTPASILCALSCCSALYFFHLSGRKRHTAEEVNEICVTAATRLSRMGPIESNDLVIAYCLVGYIGFMILGPVFRYSTSENLLSFLSFLLVAGSAMPVTIRRFWEKERRMLVWATVSRDLPWAVVIVNSTVQLATRVAENNNLLEIGFDSLGSEFWKHNSPLANQLLLGAIGSVLAEVADNDSLNVDLMPFVVKIAKVTSVEPWLYVVPAALGACTNMILPIHLPMIVAHEVVDVPILQLVLIATIAKAVIVLTSVLSINTYGVYLLDWAAPEANSTNLFE